MEDPVLQDEPELSEFQENFDGVAIPDVVQEEPVSERRRRRQLGVDPVRQRQAEHLRAVQVPPCGLVLGLDHRGQALHRGQVGVLQALQDGLELGVVYLPIGKKAIVTGLVGLALGKAYTVAMYYMHLKGETKIMKLVVYLPMMFPALYAIVLMFEALWRHYFPG